METKKNDIVNIERLKGDFFLLGMVISISLSLIAFEWNSPGPDYSDLNLQFGAFEAEVDIINTFQKKKLKPPPPVVVEKFELVKDTEELFKEFKPVSLETKETEPIEFHLTEPGVNGTEEPDFFVIVEDMPQFQGGGLDNFHKFILNQVIYPALPLENGIGGTVILSFIIDEKGKLTQIEILRNAHPELDKEAMRVLSSSPDWTPGKQRGNPVKVKFTIPIKFNLQ